MDGSTGSWWNARIGEWSSGSVNDPATLASPGATTSTWSLAVPMPARGTVVQVLASAVDKTGIADTTCDQSGGSAGRIDFSVAFSNTSPTVQASPGRVAPGSSVIVSGGGWQNGEQVAITLPTVPPISLGTIAADSVGRLPATALGVPTTSPTMTVPFGPISLLATGKASGRTSSFPLYISNNWDQWRDSPAKIGFELNDSALDRNVGASGKSFLDQAWSYPTGASIRSSPAVDEGVAYFGNDAGTFTALNVVSGAPLWSESVSAGIDSSAAVDSGLVIFGTQGGTVMALDEGTGRTVWTEVASGAVESSPAVASGVVYIGDDNGTVYALNEMTGAVQWSHKLTAAVHSSPAVASSRQLVVVGDDSGKVTALSQLTGAPVWQDQTSGPVSATPMFFSNDIYVGSGDGGLYAYVAKTGVQQWKFTTGGPITASTVTFGTSIGVGSTDGTVYYVDSKTGSLVNSLPGTAPIVGLGGSINFVVAVTSKGTAFASRINGADQTWKWVASAGIASSPTIVNGTIYIAGLDQALHAFTAPGRPVS